LTFLGTHAVLMRQPFPERQQRNGILSQA